MAKRPVITPVSVGSASQAINENLNRIAQAFDGVVSRDGSTPNQMVGDLDMNSNDLLNIKQAHVDVLFVGGQQIVAGQGTGTGQGTDTDYVAIYQQAQE